MSCPVWVELTSQAVHFKTTPADFQSSKNRHYRRSHPSLTPPRSKHSRHRLTESANFIDTETLRRLRKSLVHRIISRAQSNVWRTARPEPRQTRIIIDQGRVSILYSIMPHPLAEDDPSQPWGVFHIDAIPRCSKYPE